MSSLGPGAVIAGKYRLVSLLGKGAMGEVWRAEHTSLGAPVAIKLIDVDLLGSSSNANNELVQRFFREAKAAASLRSPHVVQILDHGYDGTLPYIAMEMLEGETLEQRLDRNRVLSPIMTATIITHVARAIGKAHEAGIVHRDLKPGNVFLVKNDDDEIAKVLDFGIAKATHGALGAEGGVSTRTGSVVGTPCYMSPEQALGNKTIDHRADLWSLGVIAYECICGVRPFDSDALGDLIVQICARPLPIPSQAVAHLGVPLPEGFDAWFAKACAREPSERFQSAKELAESFRFLLSSETSGLINLGMTGTSMPKISLPDRLSNIPSAPSLAATAHMGSVNTMTHRGLVAAVPSSTQTASGKGKRPAVILGAVGALVAVGIGVGVFVLTSGGPPAPLSQDSAQARGGATPTVSAAPVGTPTIEAKTPPAPPSAAPANSAEALDFTNEPASTAAATTKSETTTKPVSTTTTKKTDKTTKKPPGGGWGF